MKAVSKTSDFAQRILASRSRLIAGLPGRQRNSVQEGGCGVVGFAASVPVRGRHIFEPSIQMHNRGNGKGGGIAAACFTADQLGVDAATLRDDYILQIALLDPNVDGNPVVAIQDVESIEEATDEQMQMMAEKVYGTTDSAHPGVANFLSVGKTFVAGPIQVLNYSYFAKEFGDTFRTAVQMRDMIQKNGWSKVVAFQTRNPMHRAHEELIRIALKELNADGAIIHMLLGKLKKGDILVTHHTDPGWTPLFTICSGVIVEVGGLICHAAMVARELGVPAVVIRGATSVIPDGALIELNADEGRVKIVEK